MDRYAAGQAFCRTACDDQSRLIRDTLALARGGTAVAATAVLLWLAAAPSAGPAGAADDQPPTCRKQEATVVGTAGADALSGTPGRDVIYGGGGDDVIGGAAGGDLVCGGPGDDVLSGGTGSDPLFGGPGADLIHGNRGNDRLSGGADDGDSVYGDLGDDKVRGGAGDGDEASGGLGIDVVNGGPGDGDLVSGDYGYDVMVGGSGSGDVASFATEVPDRFGTGIHASLKTGRAGGDGRDALRGFEDLKGSPFADVLVGDENLNVIDGGPGDDRLYGGGGGDDALGDQGFDRCRRFAEMASCGPAPTVSAAVFAKVDLSPAGGGDLVVLPARPGDDRLRISFDAVSGRFALTSRRPLAIGAGCTRSGPGPARVLCQVDGPVRSLVADVGPGDDQLRLEGDLRAVGQVRVTGGAGDDVLFGSSEEDLLQAGSGDDVLHGDGGSDGLIGGIPGPDVLAGGPGGDLVSAGGACVGGVLIGGPGRDNASFAETPAHPGVLYASLDAGLAEVDAIKGCHPVRLARDLEDLEGSFDWDILIGDKGPNLIHGQPGQDRFFGLGGDDTISAEDGEADFYISCGGGRDELFSDPIDPPGRGC
jgi:Ca2+-binding RTX toxin-like protein